MKKTDDTSRRIGILVFFWVLYMILNHFIVLAICKKLQKDNLIVIMDKFLGSQKIVVVVVFIVGLLFVLIAHKKTKLILTAFLCSILLMNYFLIGQRTEINTDNIKKYGLFGFKTQTIKYEDIDSVVIKGAEITGRANNSYEVEYSIKTKNNKTIKFLLTSSYFPKYYTTQSDFMHFNNLLERNTNVINRADFSRLL